MGSITKIRKPPHSKTFGMELEAYPVSGYWEEGTRLSFWECTYDASLRSGGREWVSQPMPYNMLIKQINLLHKKLGGWKVDDRCGLHIHVSRNYWTNKREAAFSYFLKTLTRSQMEELFGRYSSYAKPGEPTYEKFRAINLLHNDTFEFRVWKAGDLVWTLEALRRSKLIVEYRGKWTYDNILNLFTK